MPAKAKRSLTISRPLPTERSRRSRLFAVWNERKALIAALGLFLLALTAFWPAIENDFVGYDDPDYVTGNPHVQQGLSWETIQWAFTNTDVAAWHPLVWLSHALDYELYGLKPWGHHVTAVLLHAFNSAFCFLVLARLTGALGRSWAVAALFALHPLRVESVAWVSERKDVLSMAFVLLAFWAYALYVNAKHSEQTATPPAPKMRPFWNQHPTFFSGLCLVFFALGLMSKPMVVTFPFILLLLDAWPLRRIEISRRGFQPSTLRVLILEKVPFFVLAGLVSAITVFAQPAGHSASGGASLLQRLENAPVSYCRYLGKFIWPVGLAPFYPPVEHWRAAVWLGAAVLLIALTMAAGRMWHRHPFLLMGWLWFVGTMVPVIGLVQIGDQSITDRYTYLPSIGILIAVVWGIGELRERTRVHTAAVGAVLAVVLAVCFGLTRAQVAVWKNSETLFRHALAVTTGNYLAHNNLGVVLDQQGHWLEAKEQFELALKIKPGYPEALKNLAVAFDRQGQPQKAEECFQAALRQKPDFASARNGLGLLYQKEGRYQEAAQQFQEALKIKPDYADAHFNLALELEREGNLDQAAAEFQQTLKLQPNSADVYNNLGVLLEKQGHLDAASQCYMAAVRLNPKFARAWFNLGVALSRKGMIHEAIGAFETALQLNPDYPAARTNLAILKSMAR